ncbi:MAG: bifunctional DNA primase/polymerase, partial [Planctomycetota bacterium]|nr:bifunctional DNA primase/polymerase [Planctomycetota bacterium]
MLVAALDYATRGWRVFPLSPRSKVPTAGSRGFKDATTDPDTIREWWTRWPDANIGIATGQESGLWVLDADDADSLADIIEENAPLPATVSQQTRPGRRQILFRAPVGIPLGNRTRLNGRAGIDTRGEGGYIVAPPSIHPDTGEPYRWTEGLAPGESELSEVPDWLLDFVRHDEPRPRQPFRAVRQSVAPSSPHVRRYVEGALGKACDEVRHAQEGTRNTTLNNQALGIGEFVGACALSESEALGELIAAGIDAGLPKREATKTANSGLSAGAREPRDLSGIGPEYPPAPTDADAPANTASVENPEGSRRTADRRSTRPKIYIHGQLDYVADLGRAALISANVPPTLFAARSGLARVIGGGNTGLSLCIEPLTVTVTRGFLARAATWLRHGRGKDAPPVDTDPPRAVTDDIFGYGIEGLPVLEGVCPAPIIGCDGGLITGRGYHADERIWIESTLTPNVPTRPTKAQTTSAIRLITDDLLLDFPFATQADRANTIALYLAPFVRHLFDGPCPLHLVSASERGSGKTTLVDLAHHVFAGRPVASRALPTDDEEVRKAITSILIAGEPFVLLDNLRERTLDSAPLAQTLTSTEYSDRLLGQSRTLNLRNRAIWTATANSPSLSAELARRCVRIRLMPTTERPWERDPSTWRHPSPARWILEHRTDLVAALLTMVRRWFVAGCPAGSVGMASFDGYAEVVGGILAACGIEGFLGNAREGFIDADAEGERWRGLVGAWMNKYGGRSMTAGEIA